MGASMSLDTKIDEAAARNLAGGAFDESTWSLVCDSGGQSSIEDLINGLKHEAAQRAALSNEVTSLKAEQLKRDREVEETLASEEKKFKHLTKLLREEGVNKARVAFERTLEAKTRVQEEHERLEALRKELKETKVALADSEAKYAALAAERDQLTSDVASIRTKIADGQTQREADSMVAHTLEVKLESMAQQLAAAENRAAVDESELAARCDGMQRALQAEHAAAIDALKFELGAPTSNDAVAANPAIPETSSAAQKASTAQGVTAASATATHAAAAMQTGNVAAMNILDLEPSAAPDTSDSKYMSASSGTNSKAVEIDLDPLEFIVSTALADFLPNLTPRSNPYLDASAAAESTSTFTAAPASAETAAAVNEVNTSKNTEAAAASKEKTQLGNGLTADAALTKNISEVVATERETALQSRLDAVEAQMVLMTDQLSAVSRQLPTSSETAIAPTSEYGSMETREKGKSEYLEKVETSAIGKIDESMKEQSNDELVRFESTSPVGVTTTADSMVGAKKDEALETMQRRSRRGKLPETKDTNDKAAPESRRSRHTLPALDDVAAAPSAMTAVVAPTSSLVMEQAKPAHQLGGRLNDSSDHASPKSRRSRHSLPTLDDVAAAPTAMTAVADSTSSSSSVMEVLKPEQQVGGRRRGRKPTTQQRSAAAASSPSPVERAMTAPGPNSRSSNASPSRHGAFLDDSFGSVFSDDNASMYFDDDNSLDGSLSTKFPEISSSRDNIAPLQPRRPIMKKKTKLHPNKNRLRDYSVLVDASSSMRMATRSGYDKRKNRWDEAREVLELLVPQVVEHDEDGISLYFFSTGYRKFTHVNSALEVKEKFSSTRPKGGTQLVGALEDAVIPDNRGRPETILVITDGAPENRQAVEKVLVDTSEATEYSDDLRVVFVQVGSDAGASRWLSTLDERLGCPVGVVNTATTAQLQDSGLSAPEWVDKVVFAGS